MEDNEIDEDNIIVKMRMKYVNDLEDILECPICLDLPDGYVLTCLNGHHVCKKCQTESRREVCPTCKSNFSGSRNYLAEKLAAKFEDIKTSLLEPNHCSNRKIISKSVEIQTAHKKFVSKETQTVNEATTASTQTNFSEASIECQTDFYGDDAQTQTEFRNIDIIRSSASEESSCFEDASSDEESNSVKCIDKNALVSKLPLITCFIKNCNNKCGVDTIINHIKSNHRENMEESIQFERRVINDKYQTSWTYNYEANKSYDQAINIFKMGLIFFNILIDEDGNVHGNIRVAKSYCNLQQDIYYLILIGNDDIFLSEIFKGILPTCADNSAENNNIYIDKSIFSDYILDENQVFQCSLTLYKPEI